MMIWVLALVLMASLAGLGYRQGAIRVAFSFLGILVGALLAPPLGRLVKPVLLGVGVKNPVLVWLLGPVIVFVLISILFKMGALPAHQKVDVHFRYHAGDLRLMLWERLSRRLGLCLGLLNGAAYLVLICFVFFVLSYWTFQMASPTPGEDPRAIRLLNQFGEGLQSSGFAKVARAIDRFPQEWYDAADLAGIIYNNPLTEARLSRYPAFLGLAEMPQFKDLGNDKEFANLRQKQAPLMEVIRYPRIDSMLQNPDLVRQVWNTVAPDMKDLRIFLATGRSPEYDSEKILGRWSFDVGAVVNAARRLKPNMVAKELQALRSMITTSFENTSFVAMTDHRALLKNAPPHLRPVPVVNAPSPGYPLKQGTPRSRPPPVRNTPSPATQNLDGKWDNQGGKYQLSMSSGQEFTASIEGDHLTINTGEGMNLIFDRED
jgi:uncharacterized membrane protein required for colicin V production